MIALAAACAALAVALLVHRPASSSAFRRIAGNAAAPVPGRLQPRAVEMSAKRGAAGRQRRLGVPGRLRQPGALPRPGGGQPGWGQSRCGRPGTAGWSGPLRRRARRAGRDRTEAVTEACLALSAELGTGVPPGRALGAVAETFPDLLGPAAAQAALGGDVASELRRSATTPGAGALRAVAAAWEVCERTGAGLGQVLDRVADSLRADEAVRREASAHLASVRATTRLLAVLPIVTLLVLSGGGGRPLAFLLGTPVGVLCLGLGALLTLAGTVWVERMAAAATRSSWTAG